MALTFTLACAGKAERVRDGADRSGSGGFGASAGAGDLPSGSGGSAGAGTSGSAGERDAGAAPDQCAGENDPPDAVACDQVLERIQTGSDLPTASGFSGTLDGAPLELEPILDSGPSPGTVEASLLSCRNRSTFEARFMLPEPLAGAILELAIAQSRCCTVTVGYRRNIDDLSPIPGSAELSLESYESPNGDTVVFRGEVSATFSDADAGAHELQGTFVVEAGHRVCLY